MVFARGITAVFSFRRQYCERFSAIQLEEYSLRARDVEEHGRKLEGRVLRLRARGAQR